MANTRSPDSDSDGNLDEQHNGHADQAPGASRKASAAGERSPGEQSTDEATSRAEAQGEQAAQRVLNAQKDDD